MIAAILILQIKVMEQHPPGRRKNGTVPELFDKRRLIFPHVIVYATHPSPSSPAPPHTHTPLFARCWVFDDKRALRPRNSITARFPSTVRTRSRDLATTARPRPTNSSWTAASTCVSERPRLHSFLVDLCLL